MAEKDEAQGVSHSTGGDGFMKAEAVADDQFPDYLFETVIPIGQLVNFNWLSAPMALMKPHRGTPYYLNVWANVAFTQLWGHGYPYDEMVRVTDLVPLEARQAMAAASHDMCDFVMDGHGIRRFYLNLGQVMSTSFDNVPPEDTFHTIIQKPMQVQYEDGRIETLLMAIMEAPVNSDQARQAAMLRNSKNIKMLVCQKGQFLQGNQKFFNEIKQNDKECPTLQRLLERYKYTDGDGPTQTFERIREAVFEGRGNGEIQLVLVEESKDHQRVYYQWDFWQVEDPVSKERVALCSASDVTALKEMEAELNVFKKRLEEENVKLAADNADLELRSRQLEDAVQGQLLPPTSKIDADTPVDKVLNLLNRLIQGETPPLSEVVALHNTVIQADDLRLPVKLKDQLAESAMDDDVKASIVQLLQGTRNPVRRRSSMLLLQTGAGSPSAQNLTALESMSSTLYHRMDSIGSCKLEIPSSLRLSIESILEDAAFEWGYDVFRISDDALCADDELSLLAFYLLKMSGLVTRLKLDETRLAAFLQQTDRGYRKENPYHNRVHAASVLQQTHMMLQNGDLNTILAGDPLSALAMYLAAVVHDYDHGGLTNDFLIKSGNELALEYNDISPLENHHASGAFRLMKEDKYNFMKMVPAVDVVSVRGLVIDLVLGTDMKKHFSILSQYQALSAAGLPPADATNANAGTNISTTLKLLSCQVVLKCADLGHLTNSGDVHRRWVVALEEELFRQGDEERKLGMKISPLMNREEGGITASQVGFFEIVALPLFKAMVGAFPKSAPLMEALQSNYAMWQLEEQNKKRSSTSSVHADATHMPKRSGSSRKFGSSKEIGNSKECKP